MGFSARPHEHICSARPKRQGFRRWRRGHVPTCTSKSRLFYANVIIVILPGALQKMIKVLDSHMTVEGYFKAADL